MKIAIDWDGTVVEQDRPYADTTTPMRFRPYAREALYRLKVAGHILILWSARANRALLFTPQHDPLVRNGTIKPPPITGSQAVVDLHWARYFQMLAFIERELPGLFDAIDSGEQGKPSVQLFIEDRAWGVPATGIDWEAIADTYGAPSPQRRPA